MINARPDVTLSVERYLVAPGALKWRYPQGLIFRAFSTFRRAPAALS